jgi:hypothetical protein
MRREPGDRPARARGIKAPGQTDPPADTQASLATLAAPLGRAQPRESTDRLGGLGLTTPLGGQEDSAAVGANLQDPKGAWRVYRLSQRHGGASRPEALDMWAGRLFFCAPRQSMVSWPCLGPLRHLGSTVALRLSPFALADPQRRAAAAGSRPDSRWCASLSSAWPHRSWREPRLPDVPMDAGLRRAQTQ